MRDAAVQDIEKFGPPMALPAGQFLQEKWLVDLSIEGRMQG